MNKLKLICLLLPISLGVTSVSAQKYWDFSDVSDSNLISICDAWYKNLAASNFKELENFYPSELVEKYKGEFHKDFKSRKALYDKIVNRVSYTLAETSIRKSENSIAVSYAWKAPKLKKNGNFGCAFTKQKNDNWAFDSITY